MIHSYSVGDRVRATKPVEETEVTLPIGSLGTVDEVDGRLPWPIGVVFDDNDYSKSRVTRSNSLMCLNEIEPAE